MAKRTREEAFEAIQRINVTYRHAVARPLVDIRSEQVHWWEGGASPADPEQDWPGKPEGAVFLGYEFTEPDKWPDKREAAGILGYGCTRSIDRLVGRGELSPSAQGRFDPNQLITHLLRGAELSERDRRVQAQKAKQQDWPAQVRWMACHAGGVNSLARRLCGKVADYMDHDPPSEDSLRRLVRRWKDGKAVPDPVYRRVLSSLDIWSPDPKTGRRGPRDTTETAG